jgi:hypothetical protein
MSDATTAAATCAFSAVDDPAKAVAHAEAAICAANSAYVSNFLTDEFLLDDAFLDNTVPYLVAFRSAVSIDATGVEMHSRVSDIAGSPLWPQGQPDWLRSLWQELRDWLLATGQDWDVWTDWYEARLRGDASNQALEIARVTILDYIWDEDPAIVNSEIKRLIAGYEKHPPEQAAKRPAIPEIPPQRPAALELSGLTAS